MMENILYLTHTRQDGSLPKAALEALGAAETLREELPGSSFAVGLVGEDVQAAADAVAGCGAESFFAAAGPEFGVSRYESDTPAFEAIVRASGATIVVAPMTSRLSRSLPGAAFRAEGRIDTHVTGILVEGGSPVIQRWYYRQRMAATQTRTHRPWFLLLDSGVFEAWNGEAGTARLTPVEVTLPENFRTEVVGVENAAAGAQTIRPDAELLFVAGAGWTKKQADGQMHVKDAEELIRVFLDATGASLGSSKSLVDQSVEGQEVISFLSHLNQVGQTGATPRHPKGLSTCCHGEEPHVIGWRFINERRAVNLDPNCGWARGKADVLYVADAFKLIAKVNELLAAR